jgi:hypothetical protein
MSINIKSVLAGVFLIGVVVAPIDAMISKYDTYWHVERASQNYLKNEGFDYNDPNVWYEYYSVVSKGYNELLSKPNYYFMASEIEAVSFGHSADLVKKLRQTLVQDVYLEKRVTDAICQIMNDNIFGETEIPSHMRGEYTQKSFEIKNEARVRLQMSAKRYIAYSEIVKIASDKLQRFINDAKNYNYYHPVAVPAIPAPAVGSWVDWIASFIQAASAPSSVIVNNYPSVPSPAFNSEEKIDRWFLENRIKEHVKQILGAKGIDVTHMPDKAKPEYYRKINKMKYVLEKVMTTKVRNYVYMSELDHEVRKELESVTEIIAIECGICLDKYNHGDKICKLSCGHIFHENCINLAFVQKKECPICRAQNVYIIERKGF